MPTLSLHPLTLLRALVILAATFLMSFLPAHANSLTGQLQFAEGTYRVNVGDTLSVNVYNQPDLSHSGILVRSDGNASFNGVGELQVAGKTIREITELLDSQVRELVRDPRISVTVTESKPPSVYLAGAVMKPGMLQAGSSSGSSGGGGSDSSSTTGANSSTGSSGSGSSGASGGARMDFRLSNVLALGGGVRMNADLANIMITRDGQPFKTVNLWDMLKTGDNSQDVMLQNGDSVYIPELPEQALDDDTYRLLLTSNIGPRTFPVRLVGEVHTPGVYELNGQSPFLNSALAKGGGFAPGANRKVVALRRFTGPDKFSTVFIDPNKHDFMLRPNDVIFVSETQTYKAGRFAETVSKVLAPFTSTATMAWGVAAMTGGLK